MDFEFSDEQRQLGEAVSGFLDKEYSFERLRALKRSGTGSDPKVWQGLADLGVLGINVPAALGGLGFGPLETLTLMNACGPPLLLEPVLESAVIATVLLAEYPDSAPAAELLGAMGRGERIAVLAHFEPHARFDVASVAASARADGESTILDGHKAVVL